jgi:uncharacterized protein (DUF2147 family)
LQNLRGGSITPTQPSPIEGEGSSRVPEVTTMAWLVRLVCAALLLAALNPPSSAAEAPFGTWMFAERVAVQIFDCSGSLCGRVVWLLRPDSPAGRPDIDYRNPDPALRRRHLCGLTIIWGMQPDGQDHWKNGRLYDPKDGLTYDVTARLTTPDRITARVYLGTPFLGRTEILSRDPVLTVDGRC